MGTFQGHLLPGAFFVVWALWWTLQISKRRWLCREKGEVFQSSAAYNIGGPFSWCETWPLESILKVGATGVGMALELFASTDYGHENHVVSYGDLQHVTMYAFFFLAGLAEIGLACRCRCVLPGMDYLLGALAFTVELLLFKFHLHGRGPLDVLVHTLLLYTVSACVLAELMEFYFRQSTLAAYLRPVAVLLQGTWFIQVGFILYPPLPWLRHWEQGHDQLLLATMIFTWHVAIDVILVTSLSYVVTCCCRRYYHVCKVRAMGGRSGERYNPLPESSSEEEEEKEEDSFV